MPARARRTLRGLATAVVATAVAAGAHALAGGYVPNAPSLALALVFAALTSVALAGRRSRAWRTAASVAVSQLAFHTVFAAIGTDATLIAVGHGHGGAHGVAHGGSVLVTAAEHAHTADPRMWIAHVVAGALTVALLRHGESALRSLGRALVPRAATASVRAPIARVPLAPVGAEPPRALARMATSLSRRGPPTGCAAL
ncbi:hypothetical protein QT381_13895 [Galbitalea sp. SE-J8]|uniref:hypothetical protein n=1 Tax=Galbitalea sp. SE-J8 TaxID=3054952 RepID=UPI00259C9223|nr:hypothetical protein [Galbitalea sp. SE-J8]MDM4764099.1 hypothetical protein [Galbitalea sp. SE-J8]